LADSPSGLSFDADSYRRVGFKLPNLLDVVAKEREKAKFEGRNE
jgi:hypothetical protein